MYELNFNNLDDETQKHLIDISTKMVEMQFGEYLREYAATQQLDYDAILYEEAVKNLYKLDIGFVV